jgi:hypothetical protein
MDTEVRALIETLRAGAGRLTSDLAAVDANMGELYDAASGGRGTTVSADAAAAQRSPAAPAPTPTPPPQTPPPITARRTTPAPGAEASTAAPAAASPAPANEPSSEASGEDLDGARLIALNMALNGDSREETDRYLAENFELADRGKLVDEVYAAIEG